MSAELATKITRIFELSGQEDDSAPFALLKRARNGNWPGPECLFRKFRVHRSRLLIKCRQHTDQVL